MNEYVVIIEEKIIEAESISEAREKAEESFDRYEEVVKP